jgi:polar amino acid transport system substrate-binding protein
VSIVAASHRPLVSLLAAAVLALAACSGSAASGSPSSSTTASGDPLTDKLAQVLQRGTLVLSTDPEYPPQSMSLEGAIRSVDTKCRANQMTGPEIAGFDAETGKAVARALGVEPCFVVPSWTEITGGNWGGRWDVAWGSGAINADRMTRLWMTQPYYSDDQRFYVRTDSPYQEISDLDGKVIGACASCTHEYYLRGTLEVPGVDVVLKVKDPQVVTYQAEPPGLQEVADGKIDAFLLAEPVGEQAIKDGLALRALDEIAFPLYSTGFVDKKSGLSNAAFVERINGIINDLHADGSLKALSMEYFGKDLATRAGAFDLGSIGQVVD